MRDPSAEWHIDIGDYPSAGSDAEKLSFLLRYAILAPSGHNTQPWMFQIQGDQVELYADRTRGLPVVDPYDRALTLSCGAAIGSLRIAMRRFGHEGIFELLPAAGDPDLLARIRLGNSWTPSAVDHSLFEAITRRRTTRRPFENEPLPEQLIDQLRAIAAEDAVELVLLTEASAKSAVAALVAEGDRIQFADPRFRRELGSWVHSRRAASRDGMSGAGFGMPDVLSSIGGLVIRTFDMGKGIGAKDQEISLHSPALAIVATAGDEPRDWLSAGAAHMVMLLAAGACGLTAAYLNQPVEVDELRPRLAAAAGVQGVPQLLFRLGRGPQIQPAVRRPVAEVLRKLG